jgi:amphiphysin
LQLIEASKGWRDAWVSILSIQLTATTIFEELYQPIVGSSDGYGQPPVMSTPEQLERTSKLRSAYAELKTDLLDEVGMMDSRVIRPATDAKEYLQPIRKTIKKRENKRLDWERYIDKVNSLSKKLKRSDRDNAALVRAEEDLAKAADVGLSVHRYFNYADATNRTSKSPTNTSEKHFLLLLHRHSLSFLIYSRSKS